MICIAETVFPAISQACQEANVPYSFFATPPVDADVETMEEDPLYAGTVLFDPEAEAAYLAEKAYEAGGRKDVYESYECVWSDRNIARHDSFTH